MRVIVITVVVTIAVILGARFVPDWYHNWQNSREEAVLARQDAAAAVWLKANGVIAEPWTTTQGPYETQLSGCPNGDLYGLSWYGGGTLSAYRDRKVTGVQHLSAPTNPLREFVGLTCSHDGAIYTLDPTRGFIVRVPSKGQPDLTWASVAQKDRTVGALAATSDGSILQVDTHRSRVIRISAQGSVNWNWAKVGDGAMGISVAPDQTVYVDYRNTGEVTRITASGAVTRHWATLPTNIPKSAPEWMRAYGGVCSRYDGGGFDGLGTNIVTDIKGDVFLGHTCLWRISKAGQVSHWPMATSRGRLEFVFALGSGADGSIYGATSDGIVRFAVPSKP